MADDPSSEAQDEEGGGARASVPRGEIAVTTGGKDITRGYILGELDYPQDRVLQAKGGDYEVYERVLSDDQVKAVTEQRRLAVVSKEWEVLPGGSKRADKKAAEFIGEQLEHIRWDAVTDRMLYGVFYGYAVAECIWAIDGGRVALDAVKVRKQRRFRFTPKGELRLLTLERPQGESLPARKFWTFACGADNDDEPYGLGLAHWLYWPVYFKRNGIKFWLTFLEKLGMPTVKGSYPPNASEEEKSKLLSALAAIQQDSAIIVPEGMLVELVEAARTATPDYATLMDKMNEAISKVVVGQTMTTDDGSSQSQAEVHMDVRADLVKADSDLVCESFNAGPVKWLTEWNFPGAAVPKVWRRLEESPDLAAQATRDKTIYEMGFKPSLRYIIDTYDGDWSERDMTPPAAAPGADGAAGQPSPRLLPVSGEGDDRADLAERPEADAGDALDELVERAIADAGWERVMAPIVAPVRARLEAATSLEEFRDRLAELLEAMDSAEMTELLARSLFAGRLAGEVGATLEDEGGS